MPDVEQIGRTITFRRLITPRGRASWWWRRLTGRAEAGNPIPDWHQWGVRLMEAIRGRCEKLGWAATTGPWDWYETDFRVQATIDGVTLGITAVVPYEIDDEGYVTVFTAYAPPPHVHKQFLDVAKAVLKDALDVTDITDHEKNPFPRTRKGLPL